MTGDNKLISRGLTSFIFISLVLFGLGVGCTRGVSAEQNNTPSPSASGGPTNGEIQTSDGGGVEISVEWLGLKNGSLSFNVAMNTHSGSIDQYDLTALARLKDSDGKEYLPVGSDIPAGGHHRNGVLTFPVPVSSGPQTARYFQLVLKDIAGVPERDFKWQLN